MKWTSIEKNSTINWVKRNFFLCNFQNTEYEEHRKVTILRTVAFIIICRLYFMYRNSLFYSGSKLKTLSKKPYWVLKHNTCKKTYTGVSFLEWVYDSHSFSCHMLRSSILRIEIHISSSDKTETDKRCEILLLRSKITANRFFSMDHLDDLIVTGESSEQ